MGKSTTKKIEELEGIGFTLRDPEEGEQSSAH